MTLGLSNINENNRKIHEEEYWFTHKWIILNILWIVIYVATFLIGATLVCLGDPPSFHHPEPPVLDYTG